MDIAKLPFWNNKKFKVTDLFKNGEQGVWYDPSDLKTLYQDSAGTTPVTGVEQPVGLILDKSRGLVLGSELITNGTFDNNIIGWSAGVGANITRSTVIFPSGGLLVTANGGNFSYGIQTISGLTVGKRYKITTLAYTPSINTSLNVATIGIQPGDFTLADSVSTTITNGIQSLSLQFIASSVTQTIYCSVVKSDYKAFGVSGSLAYFDDVSVKEILGNHAYQTTANDRPILKVDGNGKYYLACNGTNTGMRTNNINFNSDKLTGFIGVRMLAGSPMQMLVESSDAYAVNTGAFELSLNEVGAGVIIPAYKSSSATQYKTNSSNVIPRSVVATFQFDTALTVASGGIVFRENGTALAGSNAGVSTGTIFGNYPLYLFRRGLTTLPFNGNFYGLILRGAFTNNSQITKTEKYLTKKLG